jgi:prepilin-type N-terminal cleavage/methylation domain-containing protein
MKRKRAFTLIEIMVVVAIIGLLIAILVPSLSKAKVLAKRTTCASQLHQVGVAMVSYLQGNRDRMPFISYMPSIGPAPLTTSQPIWLADVLKPHLKGNSGVLQCPEDKPGFSNRLAPNTGLSFFQSERSSYSYRDRIYIQLGGLTPTEFSPHGPWGRQLKTNKAPPNSIWFAQDYDNFHGKAGEIGARRYVYIDGHVADWEN